jgi:hypothetical protein
MTEIDDQIDEALRKKGLVKGTLNTELAAVVVADGDMTVQFQLIYSKPLSGPSRCSTSH